MHRDLEGRVALVTGSTDGIGQLTAERLASRGASLLVHGRAQDKIDRVVAQIESEGGKAQGLLADLAALGQVRDLARQVMEAAPRLDILINNAGVGDPRGPRRESADGYELHFAVNTLAPALLTRLLADRLAEQGAARVLMVASVAQAPIDFDDPMLTRSYDGRRAYSQSKLALIMASMELAAELHPRGVTVNALHPGSLLNTKMVRQGFGKPLGPAESGAEAEVHLATAPEVATVSGAYFDRLERAKPHDQASDADARARLMKLIGQLYERAPAAA